jgi:hypothetical protein
MTKLQSNAGQQLGAVSFQQAVPADIGTLAQHARGLASTLRLKGVDYGRG